MALDPVVGWYLRDMRNLEHVRGVRTRAPSRLQDFAALGAPNWPLIVAPATATTRWRCPSVHRQRLRRGGVREYGDVAAATRRRRIRCAGSAAHVEHVPASAPALAHHRSKVEQPPTVQSVTLWAARRSVEDGTDNRYR